MTLPVQSPCPNCGQRDVAIRRAFTTPGIIVFLFGLVLAPCLIGLVMIPIAIFNMREAKRYCVRCGLNL